MRNLRHAKSSPDAGDRRCLRVQDAGIAGTGQGFRRIGPGDVASGGGLGAGELQPREPGVEPALGHQRVVAALATMRPSSKTTIRSARFTVASRWATMIVVRPLASALDRLLHRALAFGVERARRLVEQQHRRVAQDRPGDGDALALAARQHHPALADSRCRSPRAGPAMKSCAAAARAAASTSASLASGRPKRMFSRAEAAKITGSCGTSAMRAAEIGAGHRCAGRCRRA